MVNYFNIVGMVADKSGYLWALSSENGIVILNLQTGLVAHYSTQQIQKNLNKYNINRFLSMDIDQNGNIWIVGLGSNFHHEFIKNY
ncbi:MAG: hypothetical protein IPJ23_05075 [Ignavibacteriales bacterium]|nr:hypothetical protein [Ignavibacteriales bacterium]